MEANSQGPKASGGFVRVPSLHRLHLLLPNSTLACWQPFLSERAHRSESHDTRLVMMLVLLSCSGLIKGIGQTQPMLHTYQPHCAAETLQHADAARGEKIKPMRRGGEKQRRRALTSYVHRHNTSFVQPRTTQGSPWAAKVVPDLEKEQNCAENRQGRAASAAFGCMVAKRKYGAHRAIVGRSRDKGSH